jgi:hypothetical protein
MRSTISVLLGMPAVFAFVLMPARANMMIVMAKNVPMNQQAAYNLSAYAGSFDQCNPIILEFMGDQAYSLKNFAIAERCYSKGIECAPEQANFHFKHGAAIYNQGKDGSADIARAVAFEPNNPYFKVLLSKR